MSKPFVSLLLAAWLGLVLGTAALASPPMAPAEGLFVFGDYAPQFFWEESDFQIGAGYAFSGNAAAGIEFMLADKTMYAPSWI